MIVWAISEKKGKCLDELKEKLAENLPTSLTPEDLVEYCSENKIRIARAFFDQNSFATAGFWAAKAFEDFLYDECSKHRIDVPEKPGKRAEMIRQLANRTKKWSKLANQNLLTRTKILRNEIIPGVARISPERAKELILNVEGLQRISLSNEG